MIVYNDSISINNLNYTYILKSYIINYITKMDL